MVIWVILTLSDPQSHGPRFALKYLWLMDDILLAADSDIIQERKFLVEYLQLFFAWHYFTIKKQMNK